VEINKGDKMANTYTKGGSTDTWVFPGSVEVEGDMTVTGSQVFEGGVTLGDASSDVTLIKGRLATGTAAGSNVNIDATTSTYPEGLELRYNMADWVDVATFTEANGMYLRMETSEANATGTLQGATVYGVANNVGVQNLKGLLSYAYIKGATAKTVATAYGAHAELTWDAGAAATTITTEMAPLIAKITGGAADDYTKIHGVIVRAGDMDGQNRTYGNALLIQDDAAIGGAITWTTGINLANACTTGMLIAGATSFGVEITGNSTVAFDCRTGTFGTGISLAGTLTTGVFVGACTTGVSISGATTTGISVTGAATTGVKVNYTSASASGRAFSGTVTVNNSNYGDGYGLVESELTLTGKVAGETSAMSSWVNIITGDSDGQTINAQTNGIYSESGATLTGSKLVFGMRAQCLVQSENDVGEMFPFSIINNTNITTAIIQCNAASSDLGLVSNAGTDSSTLVPLYKDNTGIKYVKIYTLQ